MYIFLVNTGNVFKDLGHLTFWGHTWLWLLIWYFSIYILARTKRKPPFAKFFSQVSNIDNTGAVYLCAPASAFNATSTWSPLSLTDILWPIPKVFITCINIKNNSNNGREETEYLYKVNDLLEVTLHKNKLELFSYVPESHFYLIFL